MCEHMEKETPKGSNYGLDVTTVTIISAVALTIGLIGSLLLYYFDPKPAYPVNCDQENKSELKYG